MKKTRQFHRQIDPESVEIYWAWGLDTYEIALRTGSKESDVYRHLIAIRNRNWMERWRDQDHSGVSAQR
jgi:hypothetical protein